MKKLYETYLEQSQMCEVVFWIVRTRLSDIEILQSAIL